MLKQAREACVAKKDEGNKLKRKLSTASNIEQAKPPKIVARSEPPKMCKIQFQDNDSESEEEQQETFTEFNMEETCSRMIPVKSSNSKSVKIKFQLQSDSGSVDDSEAEDQIHKQLTEIFGDMSEGDENSVQSSDLSSTETAYNYDQCSIQKSPTTKLMKIHYQDYQRRILASEMKSIMHQSYLTDLQFVCEDGIVYGNSLILGSMSNFLFNMLADVPIVDKVKIIIMPEISSADLNALFKLLFTNTETVSVKDMQKIKNIAKLFKLEPILVITRKPGRPKGSLNKPKKPPISRTFRPNPEPFSPDVRRLPDVEKLCSDSESFDEILEEPSNPREKINPQTIDYFDPSEPLPKTSRLSSDLPQTRSPSILSHSDSLNSNLLSPESLIRSLGQTSNRGNTGHS